MPKAPTDAKRLLNFLRSSKGSVWRSVRALADVFQWDDNRASDAIAELENAELLVTWEGPAGIFIVPDEELKDLEPLKAEHVEAKPRSDDEHEPHILLGQGVVNFAAACHHWNDFGLCVACREFDVSHLPHPVGGSGQGRPHRWGCGTCLGRPRREEYCLCCDRMG